MRRWPRLPGDRARDASLSVADHSRGRRRAPSRGRRRARTVARAQAVAEKLSALRTDDYFRERVAKADMSAAKKILRRAGKAHTDTDMRGHTLAKVIIGCRNRRDDPRREGHRGAGRQARGDEGEFIPAKAGQRIFLARDLMQPGRHHL